MLTTVAADSSVCDGSDLLRVRSREGIDEVTAHTWLTHENGPMTGPRRCMRLGVLHWYSCMNARQTRITPTNRN